MLGRVWKDHPWEQFAGFLQLLFCVAFRAFSLLVQSRTHWLMRNCGGDDWMSGRRSTVRPVGHALGAWQAAGVANGVSLSGVCER